MRRWNQDRGASMYGPCTGALLAGLLLFIPGTIMAQDTLQRTVSVTGEGVLKVEPDMAVVRFGIVTVAEDPEDARRENAAQARKAMDAARAHVEDERHLRLEGLYLAPARRYNPDTRRNEEVGYEASRQVMVEVHDLEKLPALIAAVVREGANRLNGISYDLSQKQAARNTALRRALENAREKAALMADALDVSLGTVLQIQEMGIQVPRPILQMRETGVAKADAAPVPEAYAAGEMAVQASVHVVFALKD